ARRGSLDLDILISLKSLVDAGFDKLPDLRAHVTLYLKSGRVELTGLGAKVDLTPPIALGGTGLLFESFSVDLKPKDKKAPVEIHAFISTVAGGGETLLMDVGITFGFPVTKTGIKYSGDLLLGRKLSIGKIWG